MATIHSLPQELIRHTLALAYPRGSGWLRLGPQPRRAGAPELDPAVGLTPVKQLSFSGVQKKDKRSLTAFVMKGYCRVSSFASCPEQDIRVVPGKAQPGGITTLKFQVTTKQVTPNLFQFLILSSEYPNLDEMTTDGCG